MRRREQVTRRLWGILIPAAKARQGIPAVLARARDSSGQDDTWQLSLLLFLRVPTQLHALRGNRISLQQPGATVGRSQGPVFPSEGAHGLDE